MGPLDSILTSSPHLSLPLLLTCLPFSQNSSPCKKRRSPLRDLPLQSGGPGASIGVWRWGQGKKGSQLSPASQGPQLSGRRQSQLLPHPCSARGNSSSLPLPVPGVSAVSPLGPTGPPSPTPALSHRSESTGKEGALWVSGEDPSQEGRGDSCLHKGMPQQKLCQPAWAMGVVTWEANGAVSTNPLLLADEKS